MRILNRSEEVRRGIVHPGNNLAIPLRIRRPNHDNPIQPVLRLEPANIRANALEMDLLIRPLDQIIRALGLVRSDEIGIIDRRERNDVRHVRRDLALAVIYDLVRSSQLRVIK